MFLGQHSTATGSAIDIFKQSSPTFSDINIKLSSNYPRQYLLRLFGFNDHLISSLGPPPSGLCLNAFSVFIGQFTKENKIVIIGFRTSQHQTW